MVAVPATGQARPVLLVKDKAPTEATQAPTVALEMAREAERAAAGAGPVTPVGAKGVRVGPVGKEDMEGMPEVTEVVVVTGADREAEVEAGMAGEPQPAERGVALALDA